MNQRGRETGSGEGELGREGEFGEGGTLYVRAREGGKQAWVRER